MATSKHEEHRETRPGAGGFIVKVIERKFTFTLSLTHSALRVSAAAAAEE